MVMDKEESVSNLKNYVISHPSASFADALADSSLPTDALLAAIFYALGFICVQVSEVGAIFKVFSGYAPQDLDEVLSLSMQSQELGGRFAEIAPKVYAMISAIENELTDAMYLPPEMRKSRVVAMCDDIGVGLDQYRAVLTNWMSH